MPVTNNYQWTNLHENINFTVEQYHVVLNRNPNGTPPSNYIDKWNSGLNNIRAVIRSALTNHKKVRAVGGGWSLSDIQQTNGYLINTNALNMIEPGLSAANVEAGIDGTKYCLAQCGASVMEINTQLLQSNLALSTSGASDGQSIVGAISTGTHGSSFTFGSMPDFVEGIHIVVSDILHYWVEGNNRVVSDAFINDYATGATRINDDSILNAAIVSFGCFGVIFAVLIKAEPIYALKRCQKYFPWTTIQNYVSDPSNLGNLNLPIANPYYFSVLVNPYKLDNTVVTVMEKVGYTAQMPPTSNPTFGPSNDVLHVIGKVSSIIPGTIPTIMKWLDKLIRKQYPEYNQIISIPGFTFMDGTSVAKGKALSVEIGIDASQALIAANIIIPLCTTIPFPGIITFRYVKKSKATLAFTKYPVTCAIEFPAPFSNATSHFYSALYAALDLAGIEYTLHWGQCNNLNSVNVRTKYTNAVVDSWIAARQTILTTNQFQSLYSNDFLHRVGLDTLSAVVGPIV
ncbi:MAG: FAD-binding protein [Saprospiraceae bacterium]